MGVIADAAAKVIGGETTPASAPTTGHGIERTSEVSKPETTERVSAPEKPPDSGSVAPSSKPTDAAPSAPPQEGATAGKPPEDKKPAQPGQPATPSGDPTIALKTARNEIRSLKAIYGWMPREHAKNWRGFYDAYSRDPVGALIEEIKPFLDRPDTRARIGALFGIQTTPAAHEDPEPDFDVETQDGRPFMSPQRAAEWRAWHKRQEEKRFDEKLKPFSKFIEDRNLLDLNDQMTREANTNARRLFTEAKTWPYFNDNMAAIHERFNYFSAPPEEGGLGLEGEKALLRAYQTVLQDQVRNGQLQQGQAKAAAVQAKVGATTHNPARPASASGSTGRLSIREAAERVVYGRAS